MCLHRPRRLPLGSLLLASSLLAASRAGAVNSVSGEAYGTSVDVPSVATSPKNPDAVLPSGGGTTEAHLLAQDVAGLVTTGTLTASSTGAVGVTSASSSSEAAVQQLSILGGLITADVVDARCSSTGNGAAASTTDTGTTLVNLVIDGLPAVNGTPAPNTMTGIPGVAVVLNEQVAGGDGTTTSSLTVNLIHVTLSAPFPAGEIVVASVHCDVDFTAQPFDCSCPQASPVSGEAFGARVDLIGQMVDENPRALLSSQGGSAEAQAAGLSVPGTLSSGTVDASTSGSVGPLSASSTSETTVQELDVLAGLVTADLVDARCSSSGDGTTASSTDTGTTLVNLVVDGLPAINGTPAPGTMIVVPGVATVVLNEQLTGGDGTTSSSLTVNLIHVILEPPGAGDIVVASAHCDVDFVANPICNPCDDGNPCNGTETCDPELGCVPGQPPPTCSTTTTVSTTSTTSSTTTTCPPVAFLVRTRGKVGDRGQVTGGIGANDPGGSFRLGKNAFVADGSTTVADTVKIGQGTSVFRVLANRLVTGPGAVIRDGTGTPVLPLTDPFCPIPTFACGAPSVTVPDHGASGPLPPGSYGELTVLPGGTLILDPGTFTFCSVKIGTQAAVATTGTMPTTINVAGLFRLKDSGFLGPSGGAPTPTINVSGTKVRIGAANARLQALLSAPNAEVSVGRSGGVLGTFCAATSRTDKSITLACPPP